MSNTTNLNLVLTSDSPGTIQFKDWRKIINGESGSNMIKIDNVVGDLYASVSGVYQGVDLTVKFADEITEYSDEWAWIQSRISTGNYFGIYIGDYIPLTFGPTQEDTRTYRMRVAGIDTYTDTGETAVGHHIDFISKETYAIMRGMNSVNYNNGRSNQRSPWLVSDLYRYLNSLTGVVPNDTAAGGGTGASVDYTSDGVYYYLPQKVKDVIVSKYMYYPQRYAEEDGAPVLQNADTAAVWGNIGKLWFPFEAEVFSNPIYSNISSFSLQYNIQYPLFRTGPGRMFLNPTGENRAGAWLISTVEGDGTSIDHRRCFAYITSAGIRTARTAGTSTRFPICFRVA